MAFIRKKNRLPPLDDIVDLPKEDSIITKYISKRCKMTEEERKQVIFMFDYITKNKSNLKPVDLEWAIKMQDAYKRYGQLTIRQIEVLKSIFGRCD
jgi:hypothetical protein